MGSVGKSATVSQAQLERDYNAVDAMWDMTPQERFKSKRNDWQES